MLFPKVFAPQHFLGRSNFVIMELPRTHSLMIRIYCGAEGLAIMNTVIDIYDEKHPDSFHRSMRPLLVLAQICGLMPVQGIFGPFLRFTWGSTFHIYAVFIFLITLFFDTCYTIDNFRTGIRIDVFASTVFYTVCLLTTYFFLEVARNISKIAESFEDVETKMADYGYPKQLGLKVKIFLFSFIFLAVVEHGTLALINVNWAWKHSSGGQSGFGYSFYVNHFPAISWRLSYSALGTIALFWVNAMCTFNWNYLDFFLIVMGMEIWTRFSLINSRLKESELEKENRNFWDKICRDYNRLSLLTKQLDKELSKVILTSFFSNMYHLSLQLVRSLKINGTLFQKTYFYFSLSYLIIRLLLVLFSAAKISEESKKPAATLLALEKPCPEAIRFLHQVLTDEIALTGNRFFIINKKFVVSVIGTIMTYQGVLLQFNSLKYT